MDANTPSPLRAAPTCPVASLGRRTSLFRLHSATRSYGASLLHRSPHAPPPEHAHSAPHQIPSGSSPLPQRIQALRCGRGCCVLGQQALLSTAAGDEYSKVTYVTKGGRGRALGEQGHVRPEQSKAVAPTQRPNRPAPDHQIAVQSSSTVDRTTVKKCMQLSALWCSQDERSNKHLSLTPAAGAAVDWSTQAPPRAPWPSVPGPGCCPQL